MANFVAEEQLTVSTSSVGFTTIETNVKVALIAVETASVRLGSAGDEPTSTNGPLFQPGDRFILIGNENVRNVRFIRDGSVDAALEAEFFDGYDTPVITSGFTRDDAGRVMVVGPVASDGVADGNPVPTGFVVDETSPTAAAEGDVRSAIGTAEGVPAVAIVKQRLSSAGDAVTGNLIAGTTMFNGSDDFARIGFESYPYLLAPDGRFDRSRSAGDAGGGLGALLTSPTGHGYTAVAGDTQVASSAAKLHTVTIHDVTTGGTITIYDNTTESGTVIATLVLAAGEGFVTLHYDVDCATGIYVGYDASVVAALTVSAAD